MTKLKQEPSGKTIEIDFLFLDLDTCVRCKGTDASLDAALKSAQSVLTSAGATVSVRKTLVDTEQKALELGFLSSPTIRVNGRDIALELKESHCGSCSDACGSDIDCRVWTWQGREYTEAPEPLIVDAILLAVYGGAQQLAPKLAGSVPALSIPENLMRVFVNKAAQQASVCCPPAEQDACCAPSEKSACCDADASMGQAAGCGCR